MAHHRRPSVAALAALALLLLLPPVIAAGAPGPASQPAGPPRALAVFVHARIDTVLAQLGRDGDFPAAADALRELFDQVIALAPESEAVLFRDADFARRLVEQLGALDAQQHPADLLAFLRQNPNLAHNLVFLFKPEAQRPAEVYGTLARLRAHAPAQLEPYATLAAAVCLVHQSRPLIQRVNENAVQAPDACDIFDYYVRHDGRMLLGIRGVPTELLLYVVDAVPPIDELSWALNRYAGDRHIGDRYFDIKYDMDHFLHHTPKAVTEKGFTLPNILAYGGVCADQAYFAASVAKAIGVPSACVYGFDAEAGHVYVGYLSVENNKAVWSLDIGRFEGYKYIHGEVLDPQTRRPITDSALALTAELVGAPSEDRQSAAALTDAARRLLFAPDDPARAFAPHPPAEKLAGVLGRPREPKPDAALALLEAALKRCPGYAPGWLTMAQAAAEGKMSLEQKRRWAAVIERFLNANYPDFAFSLLAPMVRSVEGSSDQNALWNNLFTMFQTHPDLAAAVRVEQARMWNAQQQTALAGQCYEDVLNRYVNAGPFVIDALRGAEQLLHATDPGKVVLLYERTWAQIKPPQHMAPEFMAGSVWVRVGRLLIDRLEQANMPSQAEQVRAQMDTYMRSGGM